MPFSSLPPDTVEREFNKFKLVSSNVALFVVVGSNASVTTTEIKSATGSTTSVAAATSTQTLRAANTSRLGLTIANDSSKGNLFVRMAAGASSTAYTVKMAPGDFYELKPRYTGIITGIWTTASGNARVTEFS